MSPSPAQGPAWLVLPTYNEAGNIEPFVEAVRAQLPASARILIVDDNSPDGTGEIADRLADGAEQSRSCTARTRKASAPPTSPASATPSPAGRGWCWRWTPTSPTTRPTLPRLLAASEGADLVIGSRYVPGGSAAELERDCGWRSAAAAAPTRGWCWG